MNNTLVAVIKNENGEEELVKVEDASDQEVRTVIFDSVENGNQTTQRGIPKNAYILQNYQGSSEGNLRIAEVEGGSYAYIIE